MGGDPRRAVRPCNEGFAIAIIGTCRVSSREDVMETFTLSLRRCWIIRAVGRNPLVRTSDRVEALILMLVFATAVVVTPFSAAIGTAVHDTHARAYAEQSRDRHPVTAVVTDKPSATMIEDAIAMSEQTHAGRQGAPFGGASTASITPRRSRWIPRPKSVTESTSGWTAAAIGSPRRCRRHKRESMRWWWGQHRGWD